MQTDILKIIDIMNAAVFNRAYLKDLPDRCKQYVFQYMINIFHDKLIQTASEGKSVFTVDLMAINPPRYINQQSPTYIPDEFVAAIQKKYPDCKVTYEETWVDTGINNRTFKKIITIDWS